MVESDETRMCNLLGESIRMGRDRSAGLGAFAACMLQRTLFQCPNFIY